MTRLLANLFRCVVRSYTRRVTLAVLMAVACTGPIMAAERILVISSVMEGAHAEAASTLQTGLEASIPTSQVRIVSVQDMESGALKAADMVVTIGTLAAQRISGMPLTAPVLHILLPLSALESLAPLVPGGKVSAIVLDQPPSRQMRLIRLALPDWQNVALIAGPRSEALVARLAEAARAERFTPQSTTIQSERELFNALSTVLREPGALIATPDTDVFNSYTVQNVLLAAYRRHSPVIGFTAAYVKAGALLGLYATPQQIGEEAAEAVKQVLGGARLAPVATPRDFEVSINANVARSLGLTLPAAAELIRALRQQEGMQ